MIRAGLLFLLLLGCGGPTAPEKPTGDPTPEPDLDAPVDWAASGIDWTTPPEPGPERSFEVPVPESFSLANGLTVLVVPNRRLPLVSMRLVLPGAGSAADRKAEHGLAALTADLLDEGYENMSALELAAELERQGARMTTYAETEAAVVAVDGLAETLPATLAMMTAVVRSPALRTADFERVKAERESLLARRRDRPRSVAALVFDRVAFGAHPYAHPPSGYPETVARLTAADVRAFYSRRYTPSGATLVVAGDVEPAALRSLVQQNLGAWPRRELAPIELPEVSDAPRPRLVVVDRPGATQTAIRIGRVFIRRTDARYPAARVANTILGGSFTSRLNRRLREELGITYGAGSYMWHGTQTGTWQARTSIDTAHTASGLKEALALIDSMTEPVPAEELERATALLVRELPGTFSTNSAIASAFAELATEGSPTDWYQAYRQSIRAVDAERVRELAAEAWPRGELIVVAVGDLETILDGLLGLGLGQAVQLGPEGQMLRTHAPK